MLVTGGFSELLTRDGGEEEELRWPEVEPGTGLSLFSFRAQPTLL